MIDTVTAWFEILRYDFNKAINIASVVETTCLTRYPRSIEITYEQGKEIIDHKFQKSLIEDE